MKVISLTGKVTVGKKTIMLVAHVETLFILIF